MGNKQKFKENMGLDHFIRNNLCVSCGDGDSKLVFIRINNENVLFTLCVRCLCELDSKAQVGNNALMH